MRYCKLKPETGKRNLPPKWKAHTKGKLLNNGVDGGAGGKAGEDNIRCIEKHFGVIIYGQRCRLVWVYGSERNFDSTFPP
jgi:hypothetical protein